MILEAIADALPHAPTCPGDQGKCTCGAVAKRNVLYVRVREHVDKVTRGRIFL